MSRAYFKKLTDLPELVEGDVKCQEIDDELDQDLISFDTEHVAHVGGLTLDMLHRLLVPQWTAGDKLRYGQTLVHYAAMKHVPDAIRLLVSKYKVDIESLDDYGCSALMVAVKRCKLLSVATLTRLGANVNLRDAKGFTALHHAAKRGSGSKYNNAKHCKIIHILLDAGADINTMSMCNSTALHFSCASGHLKQSILLLRYGAIFDWKNANGFTPLHLAVTKNSNTTLVSILLAVGASPHTTNNINGSPLHDAFDFISDPESMMSTMIYFASDVFFSKPDKEGNTILHKGTRCKRLMETLLRCERDELIDLVNNVGNTPLHHMAITNQKYGVATNVGIIAAMQLLLDNGASMQMRNNLGMTVRDSATLLKLDDVVNLLDKEVRVVAYNCLVLHDICRFSVECIN
jgi:ankyrin repeat protein